jgi:hypothetical protein
MKRPDTPEEVLAWLEHFCQRVDFQDLSGAVVRAKNRVILQYCVPSGAVAAVGGRNVREAVLKAVIRRELPAWGPYKSWDRFYCAATWILRRRSKRERNGPTQALSSVNRRSEQALIANGSSGLMARWNIAAEFVRLLDAELLPPDHALRQVVGMDVAQLIAELARFRPDLFPE